MNAPMSKYVNELSEKAFMLSNCHDRRDRLVECLYTVMLKQLVEPYAPDAWNDDQPYEKERLLCLINSVISVTSLNGYFDEMEHFICVADDGADDDIDDVFAAAYELAELNGFKCITADVLFISLITRIDRSLQVGLVDDAVEVLMSKMSEFKITDNEEPKHWPSYLLFVYNLMIFPSSPDVNEEAMRDYVLSGIRFIKHTDRLDIVLPVKLPGSNKALTLTAYEINDWSVLSDNGAAVKSLKSLCDDYEACKKQVELLSVSQFEFIPREDGELRCRVNDMRMFYKFLRTVFLVTFLDAYKVNVDESKSLYKYAVTDELYGESNYPSGFSDMIKSSITVKYNQVRGTLIGMRYYFNDESCPMTLVLNKDGGEAYISYMGDFDGGRLYERVVYINDDPYAAVKAIQTMCALFSCQYDKASFKMPVDTTDWYAIPAALFKFIYFASVLGEIGDLGGLLIPY